MGWCLTLNVFLFLLNLTNLRLFFGSVQQDYSTDSLRTKFVLWMNFIWPNNEPPPPPKNYKLIKYNIFFKNYFYSKNRF